MKEFENCSDKMILTHNDDFHVDEVFAIALLGKLGFGIDDLNKLNIVRSRDEDVINYHRNKGSYIIDVGLQYDPENLQFDHHQNDPSLKWDENSKLLEVDYKDRPFLYSSCGLIWAFLLKNKESFEPMKKLDDDQLNLIEYFVKWVDICDNGVAPWLYAPLFFSYNLYGSKNEYDIYKQFRLAVNEAGNFIQNLIDMDDVADLYITYKNEIDHYNVKQRLNDEIEANVRLHKLSHEVEEILKELVLVKHFKMLKSYFNAFITQYALNGKKVDQDWKRKVDHTIEWSIRNFVSNMERVAINQLKAKEEIAKALAYSKSHNHKDVLFFEDDNFNARQLTNLYSDDGLICATYYSQKDQWSITLINKSTDDPYTGRVNMPSAWAGLNDVELSKEVGVDGMIFAHKGRFIVVMKGNGGDKTNCLTVCNKIIDIAKNEIK